MKKGQTFTTKPAVAQNRCLALYLFDF